MNKLKLASRVNVKLMALWAGAFALVGVSALFLVNAAPALVVDNTIPQPKNVKAYGDDKVIIVTWDGNDDNTTVGYYVTYKKKGASAAENVRQTIHNSIQLQPMVNGQEYDITVQSARGTYASITNTNIGEGTNEFARGNGRLSPPVTVSGTPSSARVDSMRQRLTGFFDDFNVPTNPFDETKWNVATSACVETNLSGAFINTQVHAHNIVASGWCDRGGQATRPRANFDIAGATESNPASIEFDMDGPTFGRDTWYLDILPLSSRRNNKPIDITSHNDLFDQDEEDPGNMIRINSNGAVRVVYYDRNRIPRQLDITNDSTPCSGWWTGNGNAIFESCDMTMKTPGLSPLPEAINNLSTVPNVRRHWVIRMTPTRMKVYIDSVLIADAALPAEFVAERVYTVHTTAFSYSTGKDFSWSGYPAFPSIEMLHWDNFGFTGPAPTTVVHNYIDGGRNGATPTFGVNAGSGRVERGQRTTIIPVPDEIGNPVGDKGYLYFTIQNMGYQQYTWRSGDHIVFNGRRYDFPNPKLNMVNPPAHDYTGDPIIPHATALAINKADIRKGNNTITFNIEGDDTADFLNVHLELEYAKTDPNIPAYTQPIGIYGQAYSNIVEPRITNCDSYNVIEQDLDLPYLAGKANLIIGPCVLLTTNPQHSGVVGNPAPVPPTDTTLPTVNLTAPANNAQVPANHQIQATATASDNTGVTAVEFYLGGVLQSSDSSSPYEATLNLTSLAPGTYPVYAIARDAANNFNQTSSVNVIKPAPQDTTLPTTSITAPANNTTLAQNATTLNVTANASDNTGVTRVDFYLNGGLFAQDSSSPYATSITVGSLQPGAHTLFTRAFDAAGNTRQSNTVTFTVPSPAPTSCPVGQTGTPPNCVVPPPETCAEGQTGTPPNCVTPTPPPAPTPTPNKPGDINGDGNVDRSDLRIILVNYGRTVPNNTNGDLNNDGKVDRNDLRILLVNYGR